MCGECGCFFERVILWLTSKDGDVRKKERATGGENIIGVSESETKCRKGNARTSCKF